MAIVTPDEFTAALPANARVLGLDLGSKTIGIAISDGARQVATPVETRRRGKFSADAAYLCDLIASRAIGGLVLGLPLNMDGSEGRRCQSTRAFAANLLQMIDLPLAFWDERLSSVAVERALIDELDMPRARRRDVIDAHAANFILQGFLDRLKAGTPSEA